MFDFDVRAGHDPVEPEMLSSLSRVRALRDEFLEPISGIPRRPPVVVAPMTSVQDALDLMSKQRVSAALVGSHGILLGTLTEREIIRHFLSGSPVSVLTPVWKVMLAEPQTLIETDTVAYAVRKLWTLGVGAMPVVRSDGSLGGVLHAHDIVAWLFARMGAPEATGIGNG